MNDAEIQAKVDAEAKKASRRAARVSLIRMIAAAMRRTLREDYRDALQTLLVGGPLALQREFPARSIDRWKKALRPVVSDTAEAVTASKVDILGELDPEGPVMERFLDTYTSELAGRLSTTTYAHVMDVVRDAQLHGWSVEETARKIREKAGIQTPHRARLIARNELQRTTGGARYVQAQTSGVVRGKVRREILDEVTRDSHEKMHGEFRPLTQAYSNGEMWAGQSEVNCRGWDEYVIDFDALRARRGDAA